MTLTIRSDADAYAFFAKYLDGKAKIEDVVLEGWPKLKIRLRGEKFEQSLTPGVMKGIIELQNAINRSYALNKYGIANAGRLTADEREELEIVVKVDKGSTILEIDFQALLTHAATKMIDKMDPITLAVTVVAAGAIWASSTVVKKYLENKKEEKILSAKTESEREYFESMRFMSTQETKRMELLTRVIEKNHELMNVYRHAEDAKTDLLKSMSRADEAEIAGVPIDSETAKELSANARRQSNEIRLDGMYRILRNDTTDPLAFRVRVRSINNNAVIDASVQDITLTDRTKRILQVAEWSRAPVKLGINAKDLDGTIKNAIVVSVEEVNVHELD
jgi:hypothetical protein